MNKASKKRAQKMPTKRTPEEKSQLVTKVNELKGKVGGIDKACAKVGIGTSQYYDWRAKFGDSRYAKPGHEPVRSNEAPAPSPFKGLLEAPEVDGLNERIEGLVLTVEGLADENRRLKLMYMDLLLEAQS